MALTVTSRGTGTHNTGATTLVPGGRSATLAVGSLGVLAIAVDNAGASGAAVIAPTSWTDAKGNVWTRQISALYDNGAASAGIEMAIYTAPITVALLTTDAGTITWLSGSPVAKAWTWYEVIPAANSEAVYLTGGSIAGATAANAAVTTASIAVGDAVIAGYFSENVAAVTGDSDTTNGTWTAQQTATIGSTTSGVRIATQQKVQTTAASTQSYDVTVNSQDRIAGYIAIHAQHSASASVVATGGGIFTLDYSKFEEAPAAEYSAVLTGGGVFTPSVAGAHNVAAVATGAGGIVPAATTGRAGSATATGGGIAAVAPVAGRQSAVTATGGGIAVVDYAAVSIENHDGSVIATGGGVAAVAVSSARNVTATATASGVAVVAAATDRLSSPVSVGGGVAAVAQFSARSNSATVTGGGAASLSVLAARIGAALMSGGGVLTAAQATDRRVSPAATGGGVVTVVAEQGTSGQPTASVTATGGGVATIAVTTDRSAAPAATGSGFASLSVRSAREFAAALTGGGVATVVGTHATPDAPLGLAARMQIAATAQVRPHIVVDPDAPVISRWRI